MNLENFELSEDGFLAFLWENLSPKDRVKIMGDSPKTVWIFGAGASHHYDLNSRGVAMPLASGFFDAFNSLPTSEGFHAYVGPFISFLYHFKGINPNEVSQWRENIEEFMTSVEQEVEELRKRKKEKLELGENDFEKAVSFSEVFNNMTFIFANVVNEVQNGLSTSAYHYLLRFCGSSDTFLTFNWDTLLDRALADSGCWTPNDGYGYSFSLILDGNWKRAVESPLVIPTNWRLLKLHGSTNWLVPYSGVHFETLEYQALVPKSDKVFLFWQSTLPYETHNQRWKGGYGTTCYGYYPPNLPIAAFPSESISAPPDHLLVRITPSGVFSPFNEQSANGIPSSPLLITPVRQKKYDMYARIIERLWQQSADSLFTADRIVVIGYSFPKTDTKPLELLRSALDTRKGNVSIEIIDPCAKDIAFRIGDDHLTKAKNVTLHSLTFEEYLEILCKDVPQTMKKAVGKYEEIRDWIGRIDTMCQRWPLFERRF